MKKILVPQRENPIVNRLNKTKLEKFPDLQLEREEKLKNLRKKDQAAKLERVCCDSFLSSLELLTNCFERKRKKHVSLKNERKRSGRKSTLMMSCSRRKTMRKQTIRVVAKISWMILCKLIHSSSYHFAGALCNW